MLQILVAAIAATALILTSGYAFGNVRRRRAIKELIDIRDALGPEDGEGRSTVTALVAKEVSTLQTSSDPKLRWLLFIFRAIGAAVAVAFVAGGVPRFVPDASQHEVFLYTSAAATFVATLLIFAVATYLSALASRWWKSAIGFLAALVALFVGLFIAILVIDGTTYSQNLFP
jgi:MFS family permease